jgi:hypothetical protein
MELEEILQAGVAATEKIVADSKSLDVAWRAGTLHQLIASMQKKALDEYSGSDNADSAPATG